MAKIRDDVEISWHEVEREKSHDWLATAEFMAIDIIQNDIFGGTDFKHTHEIPIDILSKKLALFRLVVLRISI